jgi:hypothetical protein
MDAWTLESFAAVFERHDTWWQSVPDMSNNVGSVNPFLTHSLCREFAISRKAIGEG